MELLIKDVVHQNPNAAFVNDVQIEWYTDPEKNLDLIRGYLFTKDAPEGKRSSVDLLEEIRRTFLGNKENRHIIMATYGQGKSHFALVLANYFGKPTGSEEVRLLLAGVEHAAGEQMAAILRDFKKEQLPFLILMLRGDYPEPLSQQFLRELERAIKQLPEPVPLPFWFDEAERILLGFTPEERERADAYLASQSMDLPVLLRRIRQRDARVHSICKEVVREVRGVTPDFGAAVSLKDAIEWAAREFCNRDAPRAGGILILFDEFSAFVERYTQQGGSDTTSLQDLLNGVFNCKRDVVFVAFSQHDPEEVARRALYDSDHRNSLLKELNRIPAQQRHLLHTSMEMVLDAYLCQDPEWMAKVWDSANEAFVDATDDTLALLDQYYNEQHGWSTEKFETIVTKGCFPLHPLTTTLFSNVTLEEVTNTRNVLGKVLSELKNHEDEPVLVKGQPNWIYPIALVDWYGDLLDKSVYTNYLAARRRIGADAPPVWHDLLKALFLFEVGELKKGSLSFPRAASHLCGHPEDVCAEALEAMYQGHYIRYDDTRRVYTLWAEGDKAQQLDELLREKGAEPLDPQQEWDLLEKIIRSKSILRDVPVPVDWGHQEDWKYRERALTRRLLGAQNLRRLAPRFDASATIDVRGLWIFLIPETEGDLQFFRQNAARMLDEAFADQHYPPAVVLAVPREPLPHLFRNLVLLDYMSAQERELQEKYGEAFKSRQKLTQQHIQSELERLKSSMDCFVPGPYRAMVAAEGLAENISSNDAVKLMQRCYKLTYPYSPPGFLTQYKATASNLRQAVAVCSRLLARNQIADPASITALQTGVHRDLLNEILKTGSKAAWGLIDRDGYVVPPEAHGLRKAWDHLEQTFKPGRSNVPVKEGLEPLLAPPFGYDFNQAQLLFCAWYGSWRRELILTVEGHVCDLVEKFKESLDNKGDKWFIYQICEKTPACLTRVEPGAREREARNLIRQVSDASGLPLRTAQEYLDRLRAHRQNEGYPEELRNDLARVESGLAQELENAERYAEGVRAIEEALGKGRQPVPTLKKLLDGVRQLSYPRRIREDEWKRPEELRDRVIDRIRDQVNIDCARYAKLNDLKEYGLQQKQLELLQKHVEEVDSGLVERVKQALRELTQNAEELQDQQHDEPMRAAIREMYVSAPLARLREWEARLSKMHPRTEATLKLVRDKQEEIREAINKKILFLQRIEDRIESLAEAAQASKLLEEILLHRGDFENTSELERLEKYRDRCREIMDFLGALSELEARELHVPADVELAHAEIMKLIEQHRAVLTPQLHQRADQAKAMVQERANRERANAEVWLCEQQEQVERADPEVLLRNLCEPPPFLDNAFSSQVEALRRRVQERLDANLIDRIARDFRRIQDPSQRMDCLQTLQRIAQEGC